MQIHQMQIPQMQTLQVDLPACRPPREQTDMCKNITLPQTSFAGGKNKVHPCMTKSRKQNMLQKFERLIGPICEKSYQFCTQIRHNRPRWRYWILWIGNRCYAALICCLFSLFSGGSDVGTKFFKISYKVKNNRLAAPTLVWHEHLWVGTLGLGNPGSALRCHWQ